MNAFKPAFRPAIRPAITSVFGVQVPVVTPLTFVSQPQSKTVDEYALATFSCEVTGGVAPYSYQYKKNTANVGTNSAALSFAAAATDKNASITVTVTDSAGTSITSVAAVLGVTSYKFNYDGVTQFVRLSSVIDIASSQDFEYSVLTTPQPGKTVYMLGNESDFYSRLRILSDGSVSVRSKQRDMFSLPAGTFTRFNLESEFSLSRVGTLATLKLHNSTYTATVTAADTLEIGAIGKNESQPGGISSALKFKVWKGGDRLSGTLSNSIALNNKSQGANQAAAVGSINATIVNYNAAGWVAI
ncbi:MAG TPA: hypothetical protein DDW91_20120 [Shewanella frigidimarina]|nr:hypothetical protein [Shewanella frigidimarina]